MLPQAYRLRNDKDIKALFAKGRGAFGISLGLKYRKNTKGVSRFAIVVGSKVSKSAVDRNKIKRRIRAIVQKHLVSIAPGFDILFLTKRETLGKTSAELESQILSLFKRTKLV